MGAIRPSSEFSGEPTAVDETGRKRPSNVTVALSCCRGELLARNTMSLLGEVQVTAMGVI